MSRDWLSVVFRAAFDISVSPRRAAEGLSLPPNPSRPERRPLALEGDAELTDEQESTKAENLKDGRTDGRLDRVTLPGRAASSPAPPDRAARPGGACRGQLP